MPFGTIKNWNVDRGFGFIRPDVESELDVFAHISQVNDDELESLPKGTRVEYDVVPSKRKPGTFEATEIELVKDGK